ncbi:hypothetical protein [Parasphingorhabdus sp.]|uniref:hypothetical protein n=1 Tax=Parasphingorhabdus sp. TaxID=2709688 RepID=UPI002F94B30C
MTAKLELASYAFCENDELCLRAGSGHLKKVLLIPPLFDEMNRMRRMLVDVMRHLDKGGLGSVMPDLPGMNESHFPQEQASLTLWKEALVNCRDTFNTRYSASFRGGCLIDDFADKIDGDNKKWRFAPVKGSALLRTMMRTRIASDKEAGLSTDIAQLTAEAESGQVNLAGNAISSSMFSELQSAEPDSAENVRTAQLENKAQGADIGLPGTALWLRAEPGDDARLSAAIANDLLSWMDA